MAKNSIVIKGAKENNLKNKNMGIGLRAVNGCLKEATNTNERIRYVADLI